jgi:hypothetical protein
MYFLSKIYNDIAIILGIINTLIATVTAHYNVFYLITGNYKSQMTNYCFTVSILIGGIELMKKWNEENIVNNKEPGAIIITDVISHELFGFTIYYR